MKAAVTLALAISQTALLFGQGVPDVFRVESSSKQFVAVAPKGYVVSTRNMLPNHIVLGPSLVTVSCERIKETLYAELGLSPRKRTGRGGHGIILLVLQPRRDDAVMVKPWKGDKGWNFRLELPSQMDPARLIEAVVHTLLVDLATPPGAAEPSEIPRWLSKGLIAHVQSNSARALVLQSNQYFNREQIRVERLVTARQRLRERPALTFAELSWPRDLPDALSAVYADSALLFVAELQSLKEGKACLRDTLLQLAVYRNWQFAFLHAYQRHFTAISDVEKWWALKVVALSGRDPAEKWPVQESFRQLDALLRVPINLHTASNSLPTRAEASIQEVIGSWEFHAQKSALGGLLHRLILARRHFAPEAAQLADEYVSAIRDFVEQRDRASVLPRRGRSNLNPTVLRQSALRRLHDLDQKRANTDVSVAARP